MNIGLWLRRTARAFPDRPALFLGTDLIADYAEFDDLSARVADWLDEEGIKPGDRVALFMKNSPDYLIVQYGIWYAGAVAVPINAKLHGREAAFIIENSGATLTFTTPELTKALQAANAPGRIVDITGPDYSSARSGASICAPVDRVADDLCWLFYTSGTTGQPKGVRITNRMLMTMSLCYPVDVDAVGPDDAVLYAAPMSHGAGIYNMVHVRMGARHVCPLSGGFDEAEIFELAQHFGNIQMFAAPTMVKRLSQAAKRSGQTGAGLRTIVYGGGPMYLADIVEAVEVFGAIFVQIYGQGECPMGITSMPRAEVADRTHSRWRERLQSVGRAQSAVQVRIGDGDGRPVPAGMLGEIMVRGDIVMPGYWENPEASAKTLVDGWLMTGDMGFMDDDGYVTLQDRSKDMIITGGSNVYPREVEEVLLTHPDLTEVSVVGRPHAEWGEEVVAFIVGNVDPADLDRLCIDNIARFKRPKTYITMQELPKNNYGKVLKTELRKILEEGK